MKNNVYLIVDGVIAAQTPKITETFLKILPDFKQIVEIGFHRGGLSLWLHKNKIPTTELVSYDISLSDKEIDNLEISFLQGDCFEENTIEDIKKFIQKPGKTLVLCDGGNKNKEFNLYSSFLKIGDVIMCHDYSESTEEFHKISIELNWPHPSESNYDGIKDTITRFGLEPYYYDDFKNVLWGSFIKKY